MQPPHGMPPWFHPRGMKMELDVEKSVVSLRVVLSASAAQLCITRDFCERRRAPSSPAKQRSFSLQWEIRHSAHEITIGTRVVTEDDLRGMFGLPLPRDSFLYNSTNSGWTHARIRTIDAIGNAIFKQVIGHPGKFVRADEYLNVPGPGTGCNGDPNISIEIDIPMRDAVQNFLDNSI